MSIRGIGQSNLRIFRMTGLLKLHQYPAELVRLSCVKCGRAGQYRKQSLDTGADIRLPDLRKEIAQCGRQGKMHDACTVNYVDLKP
jgi:hypothetical protein